MATNEAVHGEVCYSGGLWYTEQLGSAPNPFRATLEEVATYEREKQLLLHHHHGDLGWGNADPAVVYSVAQHDNRNIIAVAFGAPYPEWNAVSSSFRLTNGERPWKHISSVAEVETISLPNWNENILVRENQTKWKAYQTKVGKEKARAANLNWTESSWWDPRHRRTYRFSSLASFLDLGAFLMGETVFLAILAADPELALALLRKIFAISADLMNFMCQLYERPCTSWGSLGGDNSCLIGPDLYRDYVMAYDALARQRLGNLPRNLHSCGASRHLYEVWAEYREKEEIVLMQTRAIPGGIKQVRESLPHTYVQLTIHQPQVDFERASPDEVRHLVWELSEALDFRDLSLTVIVTEMTPQCKANILAFHEAIAAVNMKVRPDE